MVRRRRDQFQLNIRRGKVRNLGNNPAIGLEHDDLVRIIAVVFDLEGFTDFFDKAGTNKNIIVASYINGFLDWLNFRLDAEKDRLPKPRLSKFLGDGILYIFEAQRRDGRKRTIQQIALDLMNFCWNLTRGRDRYEVDFLREFVSRIGRKWDCEFPKHLRASLATGHAVKYVKRGGSVEYVSECINIASRLSKLHNELYFVAHSDLVFGGETRTAQYIEKRTRIRGISKLISVFLDKDDFEGIQDKSIFQNKS